MIMIEICVKKAAGLKLMSVKQNSILEYACCTYLRFCIKAAFD